MDTTSPTPPPTPRTPWFLSWPVLAVLFCAPGILWALASPLFSAPDEPAHAVKAVALWHGQLDGEHTTTETGYVITTFEIPGVWAQASAFRDCFAFHADVTADCSPPFVGSASTTGATSEPVDASAPGMVSPTTGQYPPLFYAVVGWGGRLSAGPVGVYLMRIASAIACGALLTVGARALMRIIDPRLAVAGVLVAATPMARYLAGTVNPNGLEIAASIAVWCTLLAILRWGDRHDDPLPRPLLVQFAVAASVMALIRPLSPAFLLAIGLLALVSVPVASVRRVLRDRHAVVAGAVVAVFSLVAIATVVTSGVLASVPGRVDVGTRNPALVIIGESNGYVTEMIGVFGWLDTQPPTFTVLAWLAATFGVVALGITLGSRRAAWSLLAVLAATFVVPIVAQYPSATAQGLPWQGRYTLPIAVGLPLLAIAVLGDREHESVVRSITGRLTIGLAVLTELASVVAFFWALRRYTTGATGSLRIWSTAWQPPAGSIVLVVATAAVAAATVAVVALAARTPTSGALLDG
jgi:hypothetical protein